MLNRLPFLLAVLSAFVPAASFAQAPKADEAVQKTFERMLGAIKTGDREAFAENATDAVKQGVTQQVIDVLSKQVGARLKGEYTATYLCSLKQAGHQIHLWKLAFKDDEDDLVVRIALKDGKTAGFFLQ